MKKLGKLNLKSEKILNQEELVNFRGGSGGDPDCVYNVLWGGCGWYDCQCQSGGSFLGYLCCTEDLIYASQAACTDGNPAQCSI